MLDLVFENHTGDGEFSEEFFRKVIEHALGKLNLADQQVELGLQLIGPERSQELNHQYRDKDKPTDVLSFPLEEQRLQEHGILPLGDIFICNEVARRQA